MMSRFVVITRKPGFIISLEPGLRTDNSTRTVYHHLILILSTAASILGREYTT